MSNHMTEYQFDKWLTQQGFGPNDVMYPVGIYIGNDGKMYLDVRYVPKHEDGSVLGPRSNPPQPFVENRIVPLPELFTLDEIISEVAGDQTGG